MKNKETYIIKVKSIKKANNQLPFYLQNMYKDLVGQYAYYYIPASWEYEGNHGPGLFEGWRFTDDIKCASEFDDINDAIDTCEAIPLFEEGIIKEFEIIKSIMTYESAQIIKNHQK